MLTDAQFDEALGHWREGTKNLGQIAEAMGVRLYDLTPYIVRFMRIVEAEKAATEKRQDS
jgi:hypothetical protein